MLTENEKPTCTEVINDFFLTWDNPKEVDAKLWRLTVAAFNSKDTNDLTPWERADLLSLYRYLSFLVADLHKVHELHKSNP